MKSSSNSGNSVVNVVDIANKAKTGNHPKIIFFASLMSNPHEQMTKTREKLGTSVLF
jgi:hypothetical protein